MTREPRHKRFGFPLSQWIDQVPGELPDDAVGMWQIVPAARLDFGLEGEDLTRVVRRAIEALLRRGAVPVIGGGDTGYYWIRQPQYGSQPEEIIDNVIREWLANGAKDEDPGGLWFALPEMCEARWK
jgi:hypothetical protein